MKDFTNESHLQPLRPRILGDAVYDTILDLLLSQTIKPNSSLSIDGLAKSLNVSPTPVREALARLEHTGLVHRVAHKGYSVAEPLSREQISELLETRRILETAAIERATLNSELPDKLSFALAHHEQAAQILIHEEVGSSPAAIRSYFDADWSFHQAILDSCGNQYINEAVNNLSFSIHRMRQIADRKTNDANEAISEHRIILEAVRKGSPQVAVAAMDKHLALVKERSMRAAVGE